MENTTLTKLYSDKKLVYEKFTNKLQKLFEELFIVQNIQYHLIESRTKTVESFQEKINRKQEKYSELSQITDLTALRTIVYYPTDIEKIISIVKSEFYIDEKNSKLDTNLNANEFGYLSTHIVFKIKENRKSLSEWKHFENLYCEIQIRTVLQHAWASISHTLQYKTKRDIPSDLQRKLFRLAGLFELADEQFVEIKKSHETLQKQIEKDDIQTSDRELNLLSIRNYIRKSDTIVYIYDTALIYGFEEDFYNQHIGKDEIDEISELLYICEFLNIQSISELENILKSIPEKELNTFFDLQTKNDFSETNDKWYVSKSFVIILLLIYSFIDKFDDDKLVKSGWDRDIAIKMLKNAKKAKK